MDSPPHLRVGTGAKALSQSSTLGDHSCWEISPSVHARLRIRRDRIIGPNSHQRLVVHLQQLMHDQAHALARCYNICITPSGANSVPGIQRAASSAWWNNVKVLPPPRQGHVGSDCTLIKRLPSTRVRKNHRLSIQRSRSFSPVKSKRASASGWSNAADSRREPSTRSRD